MSAAGASPSIGLIKNSNIEEASDERVEVNGRIYLDVVHLCSIWSSTRYISGKALSN
jgi:hypothetical protein